LEDYNTTSGKHQIRIVMPKVKKIRAAALESQKARHEPLGQVIEGDQLRGKYAAPIRVGRKRRDDNEGEDEYLDAKTSQRILKMSAEQEMEMRAEALMENQRRNRTQREHETTLDSEDDEEEEIEEIILDEDEE
jgi:hypothetical protein